MPANASCRLCGNNSASVWFVAWDHEIHACSQCGFMFAVPLAEAPKKTYASDYFRDFIERDRQPEALQFYAGTLGELEKIAPGRRLLDAGCGTGGFLNFARSAGWSVSGIDGSEAAVRYSLETHHLDVVLADLNQFVLPSKAYDVIWVFHVLEHLGNPLHLLRNMEAALVPSGVFYLGLPFYTRARIQFHQLLYKAGIANYPFYFDLPDHTSYFDKNTLCQTLSAVGLEVVKTWLTGKRTFAEMAEAAKRSGGIRKIVGNAMLPFDRMLGKFGQYQHINIIGRKPFNR